MEDGGKLFLKCLVEFSSEALWSRVFLVGRDLIAHLIIVLAIECLDFFFLNYFIVLDILQICL